MPDYLAAIKWGTFIILIGQFSIAAALLFLQFLTKLIYPMIPSSFYGRLWRGYALFGPHGWTRACGYILTILFTVFAAYGQYNIATETFTWKQLVRQTSGSWPNSGWCFGEPEFRPN